MVRECASCGSSGCRGVGGAAKAEPFQATGIELMGRDAGKRGGRSSRRHAVEPNGARRRRRADHAHVRAQHGKRPDLPSRRRVVHVAVVVTALVVVVEAMQEEAYGIVRKGRRPNATRRVTVAEKFESYDRSERIVVRFLLLVAGATSSPDPLAARSSSSGSP